MIVEIGGKWINPEHVTQVAPNDDGRSCRVFMIGPTYVNVSGRAEDVVLELNKGLLGPARWVSGMGLD
jgi:hypothetical protein